MSYKHGPVHQHLSHQLTERCAKWQVSRSSDNGKSSFNFQDLISSEYPNCSSYCTINHFILNCSRKYLELHVRIIEKYIKHVSRAFLC
jgi:hypothetical protein